MALGVRISRFLTRKRRRDRGSQPLCLRRKAWKCVSSAPKRLEKSHHRNPIWLPAGRGCCSWVLELPGALGVLAKVRQPCRASSQVQPRCRCSGPLHMGRVSPISCLSSPSSKPHFNGSDAHSPFVFKHLGSSARRRQKLPCPAWSLAPSLRHRAPPATSPRIYCPALPCC